MSILLKPVQRINPQKRDEAPRWHPVQNTIEQVDETTVAELISDETTLNPTEALMAIRQLRKVVQRLLLDSKSVQLGNWGSFSISLTTQGVADQKDLTAKCVKNVNMKFTPGKELKAALQNATFTWIIPPKRDGKEGGENPSGDGGGGTGGDDNNPL